MSVNGITGLPANDSYKNYNAEKAAKTASESTVPDKTGTEGVVYEKSTAATTKYKPNAELVAKLKADAEARTTQLQSLVQDMISKQGNTIGKANDMWKFLAGGNYTVDAATKARAQADIGEDGYWGVEKTSDRILEFAKALSGGDPEVMEKMRTAFDKGFKQAVGAWGKELPSISNNTYDAVMSKFDKFAEENSQTDSVV